MSPKHIDNQEKPKDCQGYEGCQDPMHPERLRILPSLIIKEMSSKTKRLALEILTHGGKAIEDHEGRFRNLTEFDLSGTPNGEINVDYEKLVRNKLGVKQLDTETLQELSVCFMEAKKFLKEYLGIGLRNNIDKINGFTKKQEVIDFLKKTGISKRNNNHESTFFYCALAKITLAFWEYKKGSLQSLHQEGEYWHHDLTTDENGTKRIQQNGIMTSESDWIWIQNQRYRGKEKESCILKLLNKPEAYSQDIIKDGIGLEFTVKDKEDAKKQIIFLTQHLKKKGATQLHFENVNFLSEETFEQIKEQLEGLDITCRQTQNPVSGSQFQTIKFTGTIKLPRNGNTGELLIKRTFEIQIVLEGNRNNKGLCNHEIYKTTNKIITVCRLFYTVSEEYINKMAYETHLKTGINFDTIKNEILSRLTPIHIKNSPHKRYSYEPHIQRWRAAGLVPANFGNDIPTRKRTTNRTRKALKHVYNNT